jgi:hypothetical protein
MPYIKFWERTNEENSLCLCWKSYVCSDMQKTRHCVCCWNLKKILEKSKNGPPESCKESVEVPSRNKRLYGDIFTMVGGAISRRSINQTMGLSPVLRLILSVWPKSFIFRLYISRPLKILCDNSTALFINNNKSESRNKYITMYCERLYIKYVLYFVISTSILGVSNFLNPTFKKSNMLLKSVFSMVTKTIHPFTLFSSKWAIKMMLRGVKHVICIHNIN